MNHNNSVLEIDVIIGFIRNHMTADDIKSMDVSTSVLYQMKHDTQRIYNARLETLLKIQTFIFNKRQQFRETIHSNEKIQLVGLDIGTTHLVSASDAMLENVYTCHRQGVRNCINNYVSRKSKPLTRLELKQCEQNFSDGLKNQMRKTINELIRFYGNNVVYILGYSEKSSSKIHNRIQHIFKQQLKQLIDENRIAAQVEVVSEHSSSITCPKCHTRARANRTKDNAFRCVNCNYYHEINDEVAAYNIIQKYINLKRFNMLLK